MAAEIYSVTLAAGTSSRMPRDMPPKPCCKIGPVSVIENALQTYEQAGVYRHVVVVGHQAERVMDEVCRTRRDVLFAFQPKPLGTGDAVRCALDLLAGTVRPQHVLISSGDKVVAPQVMRGIIETYRGSDCDLCMLAGLVKHNPGGGRIITRSGKVQGIIESPDIRVKQLAARLRALPPAGRPATAGALEELTSRHVPRKDKLSVYAPALGGLLTGLPAEPVRWEKVLEAVKDIADAFDLPCGRISADEAAAADLCNLSLYVARFDPLLEAVRRLDTDNVQGEWYFTDAVEILVSSGHTVRLFKVEKAEDVMAFNTMDELEGVRKVHAVLTQSRMPYPTVERWGNYFAQHEPGGLAAESVRGLGEKIGPDRQCIVARSPGRINLMGRHVDHQGGTCNMMTIDQEIVLAASPRDDDRVNLWNVESANYAPRTFTFKELAADIVWEDWLRTLDSQYIQRLATASAGDWANYIKGAALRLQHRFSDRQLRGMDAFVSGNIPVGSGLSSSSALVVAGAEALSEINALNIRPREFVDLCGEGEWFVGTRGGSGDHAAIKFGHEEEVVSISFFPFAVVGTHPFPKDCSLVVCHSGLSAKKTENARGRFNSRVACYHMAREIVKGEFPHLAPLIQHLRDINIRQLGVSLPALYAMLKRIPLKVGPKEVEAFAREHPSVAKCVRGLDLDRLDFPLRDVALYGLAECERSARTGEMLERRNLAAVGLMMNISHDGDRVARWRPDRAPFELSAADGLLDTLAGLSILPQPLSASGAALWQQPGAYGCSTPEIDFMVDRVLACGGVLGAQLAGAGLGGCIMVLARQDRAEAARETLRREYYEPRGIEPRMFICRPSRGSQILTSIEAGS